MAEQHFNIIVWSLPKRELKQTISKPKNVNFALCDFCYFCGSIVARQHTAGKLKLCFQDQKLKQALSMVTLTEKRQIRIRSGNLNRTGRNRALHSCFSCFQVVFKSSSDGFKAFGNFNTQRSFSVINCFNVRD